jgi:hypothetical protein
VLKFKNKFGSLRVRQNIKRHKPSNNAIITDETENNLTTTTAVKLLYTE